MQATVLLVLVLAASQAVQPAGATPGFCIGRRTHDKELCLCNSECYSCRYSRDPATGKALPGDCVGCQNGFTLLDTGCIHPAKCIGLGGSIKGASLQQMMRGLMRIRSHRNMMCWAFDFGRNMMCWAFDFGPSGHVCACACMCHRSCHDHSSHPYLTRVVHMCCGWLVSRC